MAAPNPFPDFDPITSFRAGMRKGPPWQSIVDFATHPSFCGLRLYPRQMTLLKLIYLETEQMTQYDFDVIEGWRTGFKNRAQPMGVQPDIWYRVQYLKDNGYTHFPHVQMVMGRRASKGILGGIVICERMAYLYSLDSWQQHFEQMPGQIAEVQVVATSLAQAVTRQFKDVRNTVIECEYLKHHIIGDKITEFAIRTPGDERYIEEMRLAGMSTDREIATITCKASTSASTSGRGGTGLVNAYDEFAHMISGTGSGKTGEEIYDAFQPSLDQFGSVALTYLASSPYTQIGKFYELYKHGSVTMEEYNREEGKLQTQSFTEQAASQDIDADEMVSQHVAEPTYLIAQLPSWELYEDWDRSRSIPMLPGKRRTFTRWNKPVQFSPNPMGTPDERVQYRRKQRNPDKFKVERGAQFATVQDAYLNEVMVDRMFLQPEWREQPVAEVDRGKFSLLYRAHADPSRTNANFGFCIGHTEDAPPDEYGYVWPHVIIDKLKVWKPEDYPDHTIDYVLIGEELDSYLTRFPSIKTMSYDQFNSAGFIAQQKRKFTNIRVLEKTFTVKENQDRFEKFKSALNLGWVHAYRDSFAEEGQSLLELELKFLQEKNGKVDRQEIGPVQTKDLADAMMVVTTSLLHDSLDRWYKALNRTSVGSTNVAGLRSGREQERQHMFETNSETSSYADPLTRYFASQAEKDDRRMAHAERNKETLVRNKLERGRRNAFGSRTPYQGDRTRGRY